MTVEKIHYEELFPTGVYANQRLRVEVQLEKGVDYGFFTGEEPNKKFVYANEAAIKAFELAKTLVQQAFHAINPNFEEMRGTVITHSQSPAPEETIDKRIASIIEDINACTAISEINSRGVEVGLIAYAAMVKGNDVLGAAYDKKEIELDKIANK